MNHKVPNPDDRSADSSAVRRIGFQNNAWLDAESIGLSLRDAAVTQAATAVERVRAYGGRFFQLDRHLARWERTTGALSIRDLPSADRLIELLEELVRRNDDWIGQYGEYGAVLIASPGQAGRSSLILDLYPIDPDQIHRRTTEGTPLVVTSVQQPAAACWPRDIKVRCRLHYYLADSQARDRDPEALGVLVDSDGSVTETSIANVLIVRDGGVISPPSGQILTGVSLQVVRDLAVKAGLAWTEQRIWPSDLRAADEALLTGTSCGIWFVRSIDGSPARRPGPIYRDLRSRFSVFAGTKSVGW